MSQRRIILLLSCVLVGLGALELPLRAPLSTVVELQRQPEPTPLLGVRITVPADAPADLGVGAFRADREGRWFQTRHQGVLGPGVHELVFALDAAAGLVSEPERQAWHAALPGRGYRQGLFFWSAASSRARIGVELLAEPAVAPGARPVEAALRDLRIDNLGDDGLCHLETGRRWSLRCRPTPFPAAPFDPAGFSLSATITDPHGRAEQVAAFYRQPIDLIDRGDSEQALPNADACFELRWRPRVPGRYRASLTATWQDGRSRTSPLPDLVVSGDLWDDYVRVDPLDGRFFSVGQLTTRSRLHWPTALNLRSVNDPRGAARTGSRLTPNRGWHAYRDYLERLAGAGAGAGLIEVWMSSWNLAFEWREDWPGFGGVGWYHQGNAERLDRILDHAWRHGIRVNLVIRNHGQGSTRTDHEWEHNPYNARLEDSTADGGGDARPGPVGNAADFYTDPAALAGQDRLRRYLIARYADHPAIFGWKLWSEQNLTAGRPEARLAWHRQAAAAWKAIDPYDHPVTTHWSGDYKTPDRAIVALPEIDYVCIDAYHGTPEVPRGGLPELIANGTQHPAFGLGRFGKPVVITEYGGNWNACPVPQLEAEHASGPWACLVSGYGSGPMLWWFEWVDQTGAWRPYAAVERFLTGEDPRSRGADHQARSCALWTDGAPDGLWCRSWYRPGWMLGYCLEERWGAWGEASDILSSVRIRIGEQVAPGRLELEWWDADHGLCRERLLLDHPGGRLELTAPDFHRHLAFKLRRLGTPRPGDDEL